jgi:predicted nucleic acid-binding Zn ribbon protein
MSMGNYAFQEGEQNDSVINEQEYMEWIESIEGSYHCPYCGTISAEQKTCCGENHMQLISEMSKEEQKEKLA